MNIFIQLAIGLVLLVLGELYVIAVLYLILRDLSDTWDDIFGGR